MSNYAQNVERGDLGFDCVLRVKLYLRVEITASNAYLLIPTNRPSVDDQYELQCKPRSNLL